MTPDRGVTSARGRFITEPSPINKKKREEGPYASESAFTRHLFLIGSCAMVVVLLCTLLTSLRQAPWEDEVFAVSTGLSLARSQAPELSVLAQYPTTGSPVLFYGPVSFAAAAGLIKVFGVSLIAWRCACFAGVLLCMFVSWKFTALCGSETWAQWITALVIALASSVGSTLPGRWDAVTCGIFLSGLYIALRGIRTTRKQWLLSCTTGGCLIGVALASTPRALTLLVAALAAMFLAGSWSRRHRVTFWLASVTLLAAAVLMQSLLLLPWGETTLTWYLHLKQATSGDGINATPLSGAGVWVFDLAHHKTLVLLAVVLLAIAVFSATKQRFDADPQKRELKILLTLFALINLILMFLTLQNALGQAMFWLPPVLIATVCWIDGEALRATRSEAIAASLILICLLPSFFGETEQTAAVLLTWQQRSTSALTEFIQQTVPPGATIYGPIGGYFYAAELSGHPYLYPYEHTTPGLYSKPAPSIEEKLDEQICSRPTFMVWPKLEPTRHPQVGSMPELLRARIRGQIAEFDQPSLPAWKEKLLQRIGEIGGKYGFSDAVVYSLQSQNCGKH